MRATLTARNRDMNFGFAVISRNDCGLFESAVRKRGSIVVLPVPEVGKIKLEAPSWAGDGCLFNEDHVRSCTLVHSTRFTTDARTELGVWIQWMPNSLAVAGKSGK